MSSEWLWWSSVEQAAAPSMAEDRDPRRKKLQQAEEHVEKPQPAHGTLKDRRNGLHV